MSLLVPLLLVLAVVLTALAGFGVGAPRAHLGWFGVAAALLAYLIAHWPAG